MSGAVGSLAAMLSSLAASSAAASCLASAADFPSCADAAGANERRTAAKDATNAARDIDPPGRRMTGCTPGGPAAQVFVALDEERVFVVALSAALGAQVADGLEC